MADTFRALVVDKSDAGQTVSIRDLTDAELMDGDVLVRVAYSTLNYKDGLAVTGKSPVVRTFPLIPGIDLAGEVIKSDAAAFKPGDKVLVNGWGMGESHSGGYGQHARVKSEWLTRIPAAITPRQAMSVGTAGYTSALCIMALLDAGVEPANGPIIVTGAAGGVGSVAIAMLAARGFEVHALTGRAEESDYLKNLGASEIVPRADFEGEPRALAKERYAGAVDSVGSKILANIISMTKSNGVVTACGLAAGMDLPTSVAPFILRGVRLIGINSVYQPAAARDKAWALIAKDLDMAKLETMTNEISLDDVPKAAQDILDGRVRGRTLISLN